MAVDGSLTLREGRALYFAENGLPADGGYDDDWVVVKLGAVPVFAFPNTPDRKRAVPFHDLHHVVTGFDTTLSGEAEIGAWEIGSDCSQSAAATLLNSLVMGTMLPLRRLRIFEAFVRGRRGRNLYGARCDDALLDRSVSELREELRVDEPVGEITDEDRRAWRRTCARALALCWAPLLPLAALAWWIWR